MVSWLEIVEGVNIAEGNDALVERITRGKV